MVKIINVNLFDSDADVICHQINCTGEMKNGIAGQVRERFPAVYKAYKELCASVDDAHKFLGTILEVPVVHKGKNIVICSLFGQNNYSGSGFCFTDYKELTACLEKVKAKYCGKKIALPYKMSCSIAGGDWRIVEQIILDTLEGCDVTICRCEI